MKGGEHVAGRGPRPKPNARRTNNKSLEITVSESSEVDAPKLFKRAKYSVATQRWWDNWASSPQAAVFLPTDWERLQMLAPLVEAYWQDPKPALLAEIRLNEERLGATVRDRQSLRMTVAPGDGSEGDAGEAPDPGNLVDLELYRELGGA
ncbi:terminase small subunit [Thermobifida phage P318]|nr:terminase small subunit [Thermobifida phage P318]